ncbi:MAG: hypothetical protein U1F06_00035 [Steroidobacteraceae bacterium]
MSATADVVIIDSGGANLASLQYALDRLQVRSSVSSDAAVIAAAPRVLLPGVGAAADAMGRLRRAGLVEVLRALTAPVLGICLGMQLLFERSEEGDTACLGIVPGSVRAGGRARPASATWAGTRSRRWPMIRCSPGLARRTTSTSCTATPRR